MGIYFFTFITILVILVVLLFKKYRTILKMSFRNIFRNKVETLLIIFGSMIGVAFILGPFSLNDSYNNFVLMNIKENLGEIDAVINYIDDNYNEDIINFINKLNNNKLLDGKIYIYQDYISVSQRDAIKKLDYENINRVSVIGMSYEELLDFGKHKIDVPDSLKQLENNEAIISKDLANSLNIKIGDEIEIVDNFDAVSILFPKRYNVIDIIEPSGVLNYRGTQRGIINGILFLNYEESKKIINDSSKAKILLSYKGNYIESLELNQKVKDIYYKNNNFTIDFVKENQLDLISDGEVTLILLSLSAFAITAGFILLLNIYSMLSEERKKELGILRAIGFEKNHIRKLMFFETIFYTIFSIPLGLITGYFISRFTFFLISDFIEEFLEIYFSRFISINEFFKIELNSILISSVLGILAPLFISYIYSYRISKLNIINAIKDYKDDNYKIKHSNLFLFIFFTILAFLLFYFIQILYIKFLIFSIFIFLLIYSLSVYCNNKNIFYKTIIRVIILFPLIFSFFIHDNSIQFLISQSIITIISLILIITFNLNIIEKLLSMIFNKKGKIISILKISLSYVIKKPKKTAIITFLYSIILFLIIVILVISNIQDKRFNRMRDNIFAGFDGVIINIPESPFNSVFELDELNDLEYIHNYGKINYSLSSYKGFNLPILLVDENFYENSTITIIDSIFEDNPEDLIYFYNNPDYAIIPYIFTSDISPININLGDVLKPKIQEANFEMGEITLKELNDNDYLEVYASAIISQEQESIFTGIIISNKSKKYDLIKDYSIEIIYYSLLDISYKDDFVEFLEMNNQFFIFADEIIDFGIKAFSGIVNIINSFLYFGFIVGILGISITLIKSIRERRNIIGMLKSIGFNKNMIFWVFFIEKSFIVISGIIAGTIAGVITSYNLYNNYIEFSGIDFSIPFNSIFLICLTVYIISIIVICFPSLKASKYSAADSMRTFE